MKFKQNLGNSAKKREKFSIYSSGYDAKLRFNYSIFR